MNKDNVIMESEFVYIPTDKTVQSIQFLQTIADKTNNTLDDVKIALNVKQINPNSKEDILFLNENSAPLKITLFDPDSQTQYMKSLLFEPYRLYFVWEDGTPLYSTDVVNDIIWNINIKKKYFSKPTKMEFRIIVGRGCNFRCKYCDQMDGEYTWKELDTSDKNLEKLLYQLYSISKDKEQINFVFWGGEPMLYWDTIASLTNKIQYIFKEKNIRLGIITNGSLFTEENTDFIIKNNITVTISHDGPGQGMRSSDPFKNPENMKLIYKLCDHLENNFCLNPVFSKENYSHKKVNEYFYDIFHKYIRLGELSPVQVVGDKIYDQRIPEDQLLVYAKETYQYLLDALSNGTNSGYQQTLEGVCKFIYNVFSDYFVAYDHGCPATNENIYTVDLNGDLFTCQSFTTKESDHCYGNVYNDTSTFKPIAPTTYKNRIECVNCPVLYFCRGGCPHYNGQYREYNCRAYFCKWLPFLSLAITILTNGLLVNSIEGNYLRKL